MPTGTGSMLSAPVSLESPRQAGKGEQEEAQTKGMDGLFLMVAVCSAGEDRTQLVENARSRLEVRGSVQLANTELN